VDRNLLPGHPAGIFVGREAELAILRSDLAAARAGAPRVVLVQGGPGTGKSSLVAAFFAGQPSLPVLAATCDEAEALLPYGLVQQLAAGLGAIAPDALADLDLIGAGPPVDADPLAVGVELLALISALQGSEPAVVLIEDLQWSDLASARALLFACRRLSADRTLVIITGRTGATSQLSDGWERFAGTDRRTTRLTLRGLDPAEIGLLGQALGRGRLSPGVLQRLAEHSGGNPLLARAMLEELSDAALTSPDGSLQPPKSVAALIQPRLAALSAEAQDLVAAASVLGDHTSLADVAALAELSAPAAALAEAERAGLLAEQETPAGWRVSFADLVVRQVAYTGLGADRRRALHRRAAAILCSEEALKHRTAAAVGPDRQLAADLDDAADQAARAGKLRLAARFRQLAATVTESGPLRDDRTLSSFELLVRAADVAQAEVARQSVEQLPVSARRDTALGQLALLAARPLDAQTRLRSAWAAHDPVADAAAGAEAALALGILCGISGSLAEATTWLDRALSKGTGTEPWHDPARSMRAIPYALSGRAGQALELFRDLPERAAMVAASRTDLVTYRGLVRMWTGDLDSAADDLAVAADRVRAGLQVRFPGQPLTFLSEAEFRRGRWDSAQDHAELAVSLARDADRHYDRPFVHSAAARVPACRGDWETATDHAKAAEDAARTFGGLAEIFAASSRSILGLARNDPDEALRGAAMALAVAEIDYYDDPGAFWWRPLQIWALIAKGDLTEAAAILGTFESRAAARAQPLALLNAAWLGGSLAMARGELVQAEHKLRQGCMADDASTFPFHRGLLNLDHGRCLARMQRRKAAIIAIRAADETFTALKARPFMQAAGAELAALGVQPTGSEDPDLPGLTAQELRVARMVASGRSNREAAAELYLSPKTVEYHLASVFTKLGINSRHQLAARVRSREGPDLPA